MRFTHKTINIDVTSDGEFRPDRGDCGGPYKSLALAKQAIDRVVKGTQKQQAAFIFRGRNSWDDDRYQRVEPVTVTSVQPNRYEQFEVWIKRGNTREKCNYKDVFLDTPANRELAKLAGKLAKEMDDARDRLEKTVAKMEGVVKPDLSKSE